MLRGLLSALCCVWTCCCICQITIKGKVRDATTGESVFSANVIEEGSPRGVTTDFDGAFELNVEKLPTTLLVSFIGYETKKVTVDDASKRLDIKIGSTPLLIEEAEVVGERISEKQKQAPLTVESMDAIAIKEAPSGNFYEGLGNLKGVDLTSASLGFKIINTRGFNSTSPVRSLQLIDGVDNQSPGLNFSLGNFLGAPDLDVKSVDIVAGASSAYYGPGAFNGVINMETKNPFIFPGLAVQFRVGERSLFEHSFRWAEAIKNKEGEDVFAYKLNFFSFSAYDWEADNYDPVFGSDVGEDNPGRFDAVNVYGDEYFPAMDFSGSPPWNFKGIGNFFRTGYREIDVVDYDTRNIKATTAFHYRLKPEQGFDSPELVYAFNVGNGSTVYQGDNRFRLDDILFFQNRVEFRKANKFFIRAYMTKEDAGDSYDPYATSLALLEEARDQTDWAQVYTKYWRDSIDSRIDALGYPQLEINPEPPFNATFDDDALAVWLDEYQDSLVFWHSLVENWTNTGTAGFAGIDSVGYFAPGSPLFQENFNRLIRAKNNDEEAGTRFFDQSALYHVHGEYIFEPVKWVDEIRVGGNMRWYRPDSDGTIFVDTADVVIKNSEWGAYIGAQRKLKENKWILNATVRFDKNQNFDLVVSPAASVVWTPKENNYLRASFSSALRNPTLADQYLLLDVGPAILSGNLEGADSLITIESFGDYRNSLNPADVRYFNIDAIRPEQVRTFELGYRTTLWSRMYLDAGYYFSQYENFIGFNIGIRSDFTATGLPENTRVFRYSANSLNTVTTQGFNIGLNYYLNEWFSLSGNYSWNQLVEADEDDPIIPAFNTPEHKFNMGLTARNLKSSWGSGKNTWGFGINYKWIEGFLFEGSPQFTGFVPTYDMVDAQVSYVVDAINTTFKVGGSNLLDNQQFQTYGGPRIGRLAYFSILYEMNNN